MAIGFLKLLLAKAQTKMRKNLNKTITISGFLAVTENECGQNYVQFLPDEPRVGLVTPFVGASRAQMLSNGTFDCLKKHRKPRTRPALKLTHSSLSFGADNMTRYTFMIPDGDIDQLPQLLKREAAQASKFVENLLNE